MKKLRIINIMNHEPNYVAFSDKPRPEVNWDLPNGNWVGIWGYEWQDLIGNYVLKNHREVQYEVWQPDYRADKIYSHTFDNGLTHKNFPARNVSYSYGLKIRKAIYSDEIIAELKEIDTVEKNVVLHMNAYFHNCNLQILKMFRTKFPIVAKFYTNSKYIFENKKTLNPYRIINEYLKLVKKKNYYKKINHIIPIIEEGMDHFRENFDTTIYNRDLSNINYGNNFSVPDKPISEIRAELGIPSDVFVLFSSSRLVAVKQIDKLIKVLAELSDKKFVCYISGHGSKEYQDYLKSLVIKHKLTRKVYFLGYVSQKKLNSYYQACDIVVSTSKMEGGPTPPLLAALIGKPVMLTNTGMSSELYKKYNAGCIVPTEDTKVWKDELSKIIDGNLPLVLQEQVIKDFMDEKKIGDYYYNTYLSVLNSFYNSNKSRE